MPFCARCGSEVAPTEQPWSRCTRCRAPTRCRRHPPCRPAPRPPRPCPPFQCEPAAPSPPPRSLRAARADGQSPARRPPAPPPSSGPRRAVWRAAERAAAVQQAAVGAGAELIRPAGGRVRDPTAWINGQHQPLRGARARLWDAIGEGRKEGDPCLCCATGGAEGRAQRGAEPLGRERGVSSGEADQKAAKARSWS